MECSEERDGHGTHGQNLTAPSSPPPRPATTFLAMRAVILGCLVLWAAAAKAQVVRGTVIDATTRDTLAGVVVTALDPAGNMLARVVTDGRTGFSIQSSSQVASLQFRRIGYSMVVLPGDAVREWIGGRT